MGVDEADRRLPVPASPFGPLQPFADRVHDLNLKGNASEALHAADAYDCVARLTGDERTVRHLIQGRMYAWQALGRWEESLSAGERLLDLHRAAGDLVSQAKTLADLADTLVRLSRLDDGLHCLALAGVLLEQSDPRHARYPSALGSLAEAAHGLELYELAEEAGRTAVQGFSKPVEAFDLERADLLVEWGVRLDHIGLAEDAAVRLARGAAIAREWVQRLAEQGPDAESPWANALLALALAKLGDTDEAIRIAEVTVVQTRRNGQEYEARLAHLAYGIALRTRGDLPAARREFTAAIQLCTGVAQPTIQAIFQYELAVLAVAECPAPAAGDLLAVLKAQALRVWRLRLERIAMLRQARRRIELEDARARADDAATRDPLTGLGNRRAFDQQMDAVDGGPNRATDPLVLLLLDLDRFKAINDTYSHGVGDRVLCEVATTIRTHCRPDDVAVRLGGDEFAVFLRADLPTAARVAERIRRALAGRDWREIALGLRVTTSIGVAVRRPGMTARQLFDAADNHLYAAKHSGRNQLAA